MNVQKLLTKLLLIAIIGCLLIPSYSVMGMTPQTVLPFEDDEEIEFTSHYSEETEDGLYVVETAGAIETVADLASTAHSAYQMAKEPSWKNAGMLAWDAAALAIPGLPGSYVGKAIKGTSEVKQNLNLVDTKYLEKNGINPHKLKEDIVGSKASIREYDIYKDKHTNELFVQRKKGKGEPIPTGEYID
jgi:hypothetical protein